MDNKKIIFIGPVGAGKTSAIQAVSEIECVNTEAKISADKVSDYKETTTVAIDYGRLTTDANEKAHLYGAPGQSRFDFMWDMLSEEIAYDANGVVLMLDNARECPQEDLKYYLNAFSQLIEGKSLVVGVTREDVQANPSMEDYQQWLAELDVEASVSFVDARDASAVIKLVEPLLGSLKQAAQALLPEGVASQDALPA
ncbi:ATP/GTP-binding protein [Pontibacterium sp.]|uniref:GTP-binding protein n=1 Tax=Pontibacterium sp. TaxID=2036026 RepID=UPI003513FBDB